MHTIASNRLIFLIFLLVFLPKTFAQDVKPVCDFSKCNAGDTIKNEIRAHIDGVVKTSIENEVEDVKWYIDNVFTLIGVILAFFGLGAVKLIYDENNFNKKMNSCLDEIKKSATERAEEELRRITELHKSRLLNEIHCVRHRTILYTLLKQRGDNFEAQIFNAVSYLENKGNFEDRILLKSILELQPTLQLKEETVSRIKAAYDKLAKN